MSAIISTVFPKPGSSARIAPKAGSFSSGSSRDIVEESRLNQNSLPPEETLSQKENLLTGCWTSLPLFENPSPS